VHTQVHMTQRDDQRYNLAAHDGLCMWTTCALRPVRPLWSLYHTTLATVVIEPLQCCEEEFQARAHACLTGAFDVTGYAASPEALCGHWPGGTNVLFVARTLDQLRSEYIGCVAVDTHQFFPIISHLHVMEGFRGHGHARMLLQLAERFIVGEMGHGRWWLWCEDRAGLVDMYVGMGYEVATSGPDGLALPTQAVFLCKQVVGGNEEPAAAESGFETAARVR